MNTATALPANIAHLPAPQMGGDIFATPASFEHAQRVVKAFCASVLVPQHLRGNNGADALLALAIARRMGEDPVMVFQNIYVVHGRAGWSASYMIARANSSGVFKGPINWRIEGRGDAMAATAFAKLSDTGDEVSATVSMAMAKAEGWSKNGKYQTMPEHMLRYRSATFLIRLYCPQVMLGMQTQEELFDMAAAGQLRDITPTGDTSTALRAVAAIESVPVSKPDDGDGGISDTITTESDGEPAADASAGVGDTSHTSPPQPEAPALDFGAPAPVTMTADEVALAEAAITQQLRAFATRKAIDQYMRVTKAEALAQIKIVDPEAWQRIHDAADLRREAVR